MSNILGMDNIFGMDPAVIGLAVVFLAPVTLQVIALVDIMKSRFPGNSKALWLLLAALVPFLGFILYFAFGRRRRLK